MMSESRHGQMPLQQQENRMRNLLFISSCPQFISVSTSFSFTVTPGYNHGYGMVTDS
jgi:hypothetical protein